MALYPPPAEASALAAALPPTAMLAPPAKWHVTLVFLGEAPEEPVAEALDGVTPPPPFSLHLTDGGHFGQAVWAGVAGDLVALNNLREAVRESLTAAGFRSDDRPYRPHLTVSYRSTQPIRAALATYRGAEWQVNEFALVKSDSGEYEKLRGWPLPA